jgi:hypothetical protein
MVCSAAVPATLRELRLRGEIKAGPGQWWTAAVVSASSS